MKKNRYAIFYKKNGIELNFFVGGKTFKTKKWASTILYRHRWGENDLYIKEVPAPITDTDMLNFLIENRATVTRLEGEGIATNWFIIGPSHLDHLRGTFKTPHEAIKSAMENYK